MVNNEDAATEEVLEGADCFPQLGRLDLVHPCDGFIEENDVGGKGRGANDLQSALVTVGKGVGSPWSQVRKPES